MSEIISLGRPGWASEHKEAKKNKNKKDDMDEAPTRGAPRWLAAKSAWR